ncbi:hypothetical protein [Streptomyces sp. NPDC055709]
MLTTRSNWPATFITGLNLRQTGHTIEIAALVRHAVTETDVEGRARIFREEMNISGSPMPRPPSDSPSASTTPRSATTTQSPRPSLVCATSPRGGDLAYYVDIAHFMAGLALSGAVTGRRAATRSRWRALVAERREYLRNVR